LVTNLFLIALVLLGIPIMGDANTQEAINAELIQLSPEEFLNLEYDLYRDFSYDEAHFLEHELGMSTRLRLRDTLEYEWTVLDIEHAALMVQTEMYTLGEAGMISALSTAYERMASPLWCSYNFCSADLYTEMRRPRQFFGPEVALQNGATYEDVLPKSLLVVYKFILGYREGEYVFDITDGSEEGGLCLGYEYFDTGIASCEISSGWWYIPFFSSDIFIGHQENQEYRNLIVPRMDRPMFGDKLASSNERYTSVR